MNSAEWEKAIKASLKKGFGKWNDGYQAWLEWCDECYISDAHYNIYGHRMTLKEYEDNMKLLFGHFTMELGAFDNVIIRDDWAAIRYTVKIKNLDTGKEVLQHTMEFVNYAENPDHKSVRVIEGWALSDSPLSGMKA